MKTVDQISLSFKGSDLPVSRLSCLLASQPTIQRGQSRQVLPIGTTEAITYCSFAFYLKKCTLESAISQFSTRLQVLRQIPNEQFSKIQLGIPIKDAVVIDEVLTKSVIKLLNQARVHLWLDIYFKAGDILEGPHVSGAPAETTWYGGLVDSSKYLQLPSEMDCREILRKSQDQGQKYDEVSAEGYVVTTFVGIAYRTNRSVEITPDQFCQLSARNSALRIVVGHLELI